jgi:hypothetical protein
MTNSPDVQYVFDANGNIMSAIVPIGFWREIASELETARMLKSETMKHRLLEAKQRQEGIAIEEVREKLADSLEK